MNEDLENSEIMEAYNRLSLLLDQQQQKINQESENSYEKPSTLADKIDILTTLIAAEAPIESDNAQQNGSHKDTESDHSFGALEKLSRDVIPHMDDLITVLVNNNIASNEMANRNGNGETAFFASEDPSQKKRTVFRTKKKDPFAIFKKTSPEEFSKTLERFFHFEQQKKDKIENIRKEIELNEQKQIKLHPEINAESHILAGQRTKPLHLRTNEILFAREEKNKRLKDQFDLERRQKDPSPSYQPNLSLNKKSAKKNEKTGLSKDKIDLKKNKKDPSPNDEANLSLTKKSGSNSARKKKSTRKKSEFLRDVESWYKKRNDKIQAAQISNMKEDYKNMPFKPKINNKWKKIAKMDDFQSIEDRLLDAGKQYKEKEKRQILSSTPTFTPKINKKSQKIVEQRSKSPKVSDFHSVSVERKPRPSFLENTISYISKETSKFQAKTDENDLRFKSANSKDSYFEKNKKKHKINFVEFNESNQFVVEALKNKNGEKVTLKIT